MNKPKIENYYYAMGVVCGEIDHHLWMGEKEAKEFYQKSNRIFIKGWNIELINGERIIKRWEKINSLCKEVLKEVEEKKLSIEELINRLPDEV